MGVRSLDGVKYISRSLPGMNHLGSGHVLINNRQSSREDRHPTDSANPYRHEDTQYGSFAANRQQQPARKKISRKSHERERFGAGWMLTLVRQLVELEKRRRDYCSDPREPADGR